MQKFFLFLFIFTHLAMAQNMVSDRYTLSKSYVLNPGDRLTVPPQYIHPLAGNIAQEMGITRWLGDSRNYPVSNLFYGPRTYSQLYLPAIDANQQQIYIKAGDFTLTQDIKTIKIEKQTYAYTREENPPSSFILTSDTSSHENHAHANDLENCPHPSSIFENEVIQRLADQTKKILDRLDQEIHKKTMRSVSNRGSVKDVIANFNSSCRPFSFQAFYQEAKIQATKHHIPLDVLLGIMMQETAGTCNSNRNEANGTTSVGLFQINSGSANLPVCSNDQLGNRKCLNSIYGNLDEAIRILKQKYKRINGNFPAQEGHHIFDGLNLNERNKWRKALSAYNGGEGHVMQAYKDIMHFNNVYDLELEADEWELRKIFMLRRTVEREGGKLFPSPVKTPMRRSRENTIYNLSYVDSIVHPETNQTFTSQAEKWIKYIQGH